MPSTRWERYGRPHHEAGVSASEAGEERLLPVEEVHESGALLVRVEVPGVDPDRDVTFSVSDCVLHITVRRRLSAKGIYRSEFRYGELSRDLTLTAGIEADAITAGYEAGIIELRIPWPTPRPRPQKVTPKVAKGPSIARRAVRAGAE